MNRQIEDKIKEIYPLEDDVREYINTTRYQNDLISNSDNWNQICCSLDTINDTLCSISGYINSDYPKQTGLKYLFTYGLLQALFIQQDAISHLSEAFSIQYSRSDTLKQIRLLRNAAIGHPTKQDRTSNGHTYYNYISRVTLSKTGFTLIRSYDQGKTEFIDIDLYQIINDQLDGVRSGYEAVANKLKEADKMHKEKYKKEPLINIFHSTMGYNFQKIAEGIHAPNSSKIAFGFRMLKIVQETYSEFENELKERGDIDSGLQHDIDDYKHALAKLESYLGREQEHMSKSDANIYYFYIYEHHKHFEQIARAVDEDYAAE